MLLLYNVNNDPTDENLTIQYLDHIYDEMERSNYSN
jgi:hypothetical protein